MLNHVSQKLEVVDVADEIQTVHLREADEYVLKSKDTKQNCVKASRNYFLSNDQTL